MLNTNNDRGRWGVAQILSEQGYTAFAMDEGLYLSFFSNCVRLTPPLNISREDLDHGLDILDRTLEIADRHCTA